jgi:hypothetical protein
MPSCLRQCQYVPAHGDDSIGSFQQSAGEAPIQQSGGRLDDKPDDGHGHQFGFPERDFTGIHRFPNRTADDFDRVTVGLLHIVQEPVLGHHQKAEANVILIVQAADFPDQAFEADPKRARRCSDVRHDSTVFGIAITEQFLHQSVARREMGI